MREQLEKKFFPFVIKPGRYAGGEMGQIIKNPDGKVKYLHAFPDKYELGQSYLGLQTLYHVVNSDDRFLCERVFAVDSDAEEVMRREGLTLFSLESFRPVKEFDAIGFTLTYELVYTNVLSMLDLAGIPLRSQDRTDEHPIIMAGGPAVYNPEPLAEFIDIFFIGDAEEGLPHMLSVLHDHKDADRLEKLKHICRNVPSVYIPAFYDENKQPLHDFAPEKISARVETELKPNYYPRQPLVPLIDTVHSHLAIEIMRGCPQGCRYCQAGPMYRPVRLRPKREIIEQIEAQLSQTGHDEISLLSLSSSDYPEIEDLAISVARRLDKQKVSISLPSLRPGTLSGQLLDAIKKVRKAGLTLSPEAGTERLRRFIRKDIPDQAIIETARLAFERGWTTIKLYFMIGLPTETDEDLMGIVRLLKRVYDIGYKFPGRKTINVTLSPFVPKAHTPFQWDGMDSTAEILRKIKFIKRNNRINQINFKYPLVESSILQCLLGRGGRETGRVIGAAYEKGCRFDGWSENFSYDKWVEAFKENGLDVEGILEPIPFERQLPWSHVHKGPNVEHLYKERQRTSFEQVEYEPRPTTSIADAEPARENAFGRSKKKVATRSATAPTKNQVRLRWGKDERLKYMSHLDNIRAIERAIRRAELPVAYSQGFNPSMKLSFGPPLPLGFTSESEYVDVTLETNLQPYMIENMKKTIPDGMFIIEAKSLVGKTASLSATLNRVTYRIDINNLLKDTDLRRTICSLLDSETLEIERVGKNQTTTIDIRSAIYDISVAEGAIEMTLGIGEGGYAKPSEVVPLLIGDSFEKHWLNRLHRQELFRLSQKGEHIKGMDV
jgi:radical SAM family uncharacterized protein/radical SAM-linked protein